MGGEQFCPRDGTPLVKSLPDDPLAGRVLSGRYRLIEVIGRGGMGAVYRAHHLLMDKGVAVKVLRQELASDPEAVARFHREARSASRLDHENIIRVSDFGQTDDGLLFLVMELLDGENLAQALSRGALPWRRVAAIIREVALGLGHAHEQGVIHRDLKPENIVLLRRGKTRQGSSVKVLDFGLAKRVPLKSKEDGSAQADGCALEPDDLDVPSQPLTRTGVIFGTPEYMSPEQAEGRPLDARADLYALGVVSYQMLSGKLPFAAPTFLSLIAKTVHDPPPPLRTALAESNRLLAQALPAELETLVLRCLAKSPESRPQTADEIADALTALLGRFPDEQVRSGEIPISQPPPPSKDPAGGVARTVPRHLPPGQLPRTTPRESANHAQGQGPKSRDAEGEGTPPLLREAALPPDETPATLSADAPLSAVAARPSRERAAEVRSASADLAGATARKMPRRTYWLSALALLVLVPTGVYLVRANLKHLGKPGAKPEFAGEPLRRARELLSAQPLSLAAAEEALQILREVRTVHNTPEVHRLLARSYEAENNHLRALGHLYIAVRLGINANSAGGGQAALGAEAARSQLALAQLLSRLGHRQEACQAATAVLAKQTGQHPIGRKDADERDLRRQAEALLATLHCF